MSEVESKLDFIQHLAPDMSIKILTHLDDPCDLVRVSAVSPSWYQFVIENGLCKKLCFKMFPQISDVYHSIEVDNIIEPIEPISDMLGICTHWERLKRNHKVYAALAFDLTPCVNNCITKAIAASSTNSYPEESILNTLEPGERTENRASYWLSGGNTNYDVPLFLLYKLCSKSCFITDIRVQPFQDGSPIYSSRFVRFRIGHPRCLTAFNTAIAHGMAVSLMLEHETHFEWTHTSPSYRMLQENRLQEFKLPEPSLCIGGVLLVELGCRVQKRGLFYYTGISHVQVVGLPISPAFDVKIRLGSGKYTLKYSSKTNNCLSSAFSCITLSDVKLWLRWLALLLLLLLLDVLVSLCIHSVKKYFSQTDNSISLASSITKWDVMFWMVHFVLVGLLLKNRNL